MPQINGLGQVSATPGDNLQGQLMEAMVRKQMQDSVNQTQLATQGAYSQRAAQDTLTHGTFAQNAAQETAIKGAYADRAAQEMAMQRDKFAGEGELEKTRGANAVNLQHEGNMPAMGELDFRKLQYGDTSPAIKAKAEAEAARARMTARLMEEFMGGQGGGAPAMPGALPTGGAPGAAMPAASPSGFGGMSEANRLKVFGSLFGVQGLGEDSIDAAVRESVGKRIGAAEDPGSALAEYRTTGKAPAPTFDPASGASQEYAAVSKLAEPDIKGIQDLITSHNWWLGPQNRVELSSRMQALSAKMKSLGVSPRTQALIESEMKMAAQKSLKENGVAFQAAGSDAARSELGL